MAIETFEDIIEEIMDGLRIYGVHDDEEIMPCRCCASSSLSSRLREAFYVEEAMKSLKRTK